MKNWTKEPWPTPGLALFLTGNDPRRAVTCVNAMRGVTAKPEGSVRDAIKGAWGCYQLAILKWGNLDPDATKIMEDARAALAGFEIEEEKSDDSQSANSVL